MIPTDPHDETPTADERRARVVAFYLPQFHPVPENDDFWGPGFTEWTNVAAARRWFPGHRQPRLPGELGFYDLRLPETRVAQAALAEQYGIEAFCYWHYWFGGGRRILERPVTEVLESGEPRLPFCLGWANGSWTGIWHGEPHRVLIEQTYPGMDDHDRHFDELVPFFHDERYVRVDGDPVFFVLRPDEVPDAARVMDRWRHRALDAGLSGLHLVASSRDGSVPAGFDAAVTVRLPPRVRARPRWRRVIEQRLPIPTLYRYEDVIDGFFSPGPLADAEYPCVFPNWDNTPRSGADALVLTGESPALFGAALERAIQGVEHRPEDRRLVWVKSWNEWAEGNYLEPDRVHGRGFLEAVRERVTSGTRPCG